MEENKYKKFIIPTLIILLLIVIGISIYAYLNKDKGNNNQTNELKSTIVDLNTLMYNGKEIIKYTQNDIDKFKGDFKNNFLDDIYITEFLFDGVGMYKAYDLDDFIEKGNDYEIKPLKINVLNINTNGNVKLSGEFTGMVAINSNILNEVNLILDGVKIDTDSKKVPAIYVYNKNIISTSSNITIIANENTKNYIEGGKLKKVSLVGSDELTNYTEKYSSENISNYEKYTNYYGVYKSSDISDILFAKVTADNDDLKDGDPYYFYKAAGAISSDIDLTFKGSGYLEVKSKNKEGIETKGNLEFAGGIGDYVIYAEDDCLNTTTKNSFNNARNTLTINVNSLTAIVSNDADEGDAIDSNGNLYINGGKILAIAKPGADAGIDSETGTFINGGEVIATGDMADPISSNSKQNYVIFSFTEKPEKDNIITLLDSNDNVIFSYVTDRTYTNLVYSSSKLKDGTYNLYKDGTINGTLNNGVYNDIESYEKGTQLGYANAGVMGGNLMGEKREMEREEPPEKKEMEGQKPSGNPPVKPNENFNMPNEKLKATNKDFVISGIANGFNGIGTLTN